GGWDRRRRRARRGDGPRARWRPRRSAGRGHSSSSRPAGRRSSDARSGRPSSPSPRRGWRRRRTRSADDPRSALRTARPSRSPGWWDYPCRRYAGRRRARVSGDGRRRGPRPPRPAVRANASWRNLSHARLTTNQRSPSMTLMSPLSIVVVGAGGVGGYFGARLALAGAAVRFVARGAHLDAIRRDGLAGRSMTEGERVGELDGRTTPRCERVRDALGAASVPVEISSDIRRVLWEKYLFICAQAGLTALTRCPVGVVRSIPETWRMFRTILEEVAALGRASGVALPANVVETLVKQGEALPAALMASLGNDLMQGRRLELA